MKFCFHHIHRNSSKTSVHGFDSLISCMSTSYYSTAQSASAVKKIINRCQQQVVKIRNFTAENRKCYKNSPQKTMILSGDFLMIYNHLRWIRRSTKNEGTKEKTFWVYSSSSIKVGRNLYYLKVKSLPSVCWLQQNSLIKIDTLG